VVGLDWTYTCRRNVGGDISQTGNAVRRLRAKFSKLTHDDVSHGEGDRAYLVGRLKERYGITLDAAQLKVAQFERLLN